MEIDIMERDGSFVPELRQSSTLTTGVEGEAGHKSMGKKRRGNRKGSVALDVLI